jgi:PAS domain S-box-containing protein
MPDAKPTDQIHKAEGLYRMILESSGDGILILDGKTGRAEDVNSALTELLGYPAEAFLDRTLPEIAAFAASPLGLAVFRELQETGAIRYGDLPLQTKAGRPIHVAVTGNSHRINGRMMIHCQLSDITARRQAEGALIRERDQLRFLLNVCRMTDVRIDGLSAAILEECIQVSESEWGFFGFLDSNESVLTVDLWRGKAVENCAVHDKPVVFSLAEAGIWAEAIRQRSAVISNDGRPDPRINGFPAGHVAISRLMSVPVLDGGRAVAVAVVANKPSDYCEADCLHVQLFLENVWDLLQRQRMVTALRESEERFRTIADFTYNWETWRDAEGRYRYISPACERISGYSAEKFMDDPDLLIRIVHPDDRAYLILHEQVEMATEQPYDFNFRILARNCEERWIKHICQPVFNSSGKALGRRASYQDITLLKRLEIELATYNQKLEAQVKERTESLEELNTALKVLLERREKDKSELEEGILSNVQELILPYLEKLKCSRLNTAQETYASLIEQKLKDITSPFLHRLSAVQQHLTPHEIQITDLIRRGKSSKEIAAVLNIADRTVHFHRENIRRKLSLTGHKTNLRSYLLSLG